MNLAFPRPEYPKYGELTLYVDVEGHLRLLEPFTFERAAGRVETIEEHFPSDLASMPPIVRRWFPPWGRYTKAALVHDHDYSEGRISRTEADLWFLWGMLVLGVPPWKALLFFAAVYCFGWWAWRKHRRRDLRS